MRHPGPRLPSAASQGAQTLTNPCRLTVETVLHFTAPGANATTLFSATHEIFLGVKGLRTVSNARLENVRLSLSYFTLFAVACPQSLARCSGHDEHISASIDFFFAHLDPFRKQQIALCAHQSAYLKQS